MAKQFQCCLIGLFDELYYWSVNHQLCLPVGANGFSDLNCTIHFSDDFLLDSPIFLQSLFFNIGEGHYSRIKNQHV